MYTHTLASDSSKISVSWAPVQGAVSYDVVLSPDTGFTNTTCDITYPDVSGNVYTVDTAEFYHRGPNCDQVHSYSVGVRAVVTSDNKHKFKSAFSRAGKNILYY